MPKTLNITRLRGGGLITNYHCTSACRHCLYRCSPRWEREFISPEVIRGNLARVRELGCRSVHVGGGEPMLDPDCVGTVLEIAAEVGVGIEYVETNSSWFRGLDESCRILERLAQKGLATLLVSMSPFHNEGIPFYKVKGVLEACRRTGVSVFPWVADFAAELAAFDDRRTHSLDEYERRFGPGYLKSLPGRYWISPGGRALTTFAGFSQKRAVAELVQGDRRGCAELSDVTHFHVDLFGNYIPGLCAGLTIRLEELGAPLPEDEYPVLTRLHAGGVGALVSFAGREYGYRPSAPAYASKCALCHDVRRFLVVERGVRSRELGPIGHYLNE